MLWDYTLILFVCAIFFSFMAFYKNVDNIGQVLFMFFGGLSWYGFGASLLKITFKWAGSTNVISYTYIPSTESFFVYLFYAMGLLMTLLGIIRAITIVYGDTINSFDQLTSERREAFRNR